jgi:predicted nucleic acid-binding Zn ribbon protein
MTDAPVDACESCGASPVEKVLYPVAVHFKGSGFYSTDYGRGSRKAAKDGTSDGGSGETKTPAAGESGGSTGAKDSGSSATGTSSGGSSSSD